MATTDCTDFSPGKDPPNPSENAYALDFDNFGILTRIFESFTLLTHAAIRRSFRILPEVLEVSHSRMDRVMSHRQSNVSLGGSLDNITVPFN